MSLFLEVSDQYQSIFENNHQKLKHMQNEHNGSEQRYENTMKIYNKNFIQMVNYSTAICGLVLYIGYKIMNFKNTSKS